MTTGTQILRTKLFIPPARFNQVHRARLHQKLNSGLAPGCRLVLVSAPPGFGKTSLLVDWIQSARLRTGWLSLDHDDNDPLRFWEYVTAAIQTQYPETGKMLLAAIHSPQPPPAELMPTELLNDLAELPSDLIIVLDDYHQIENRSIHESINFFVDHLPPMVKLVIATRADPPLVLSRRRGRGELCEVRAADLRFSGEEGEAYFNHEMKLDLNETDRRSLMERTEGWVVGLQMAALTLQNSVDRHNAVEAFRGDDRYIADYLIEEVLQQQDEAVQTFLLNTCVLEQLCGPLCRALTEMDNCQQMLVDLEAANLFLVPLDNRREWFRYHHLFASLLRQVLVQKKGAAALSELQMKASRWFESQHDFKLAIHYAVLAQDYARALGLCGRAAFESMRQGDLIQIYQWGNIFKDTHIVNSPEMCIVFAWASLGINRFDKAAYYINLVESWSGISLDQLLDLPDRLDQLDDRQRLSMVEIMAISATIYLFRGNHHKVMRLCELAQKMVLSPASPAIAQRLLHLRAPIEYNLGVAFRMAGNLEEAIEHFKIAYTEAEITQNLQIQLVSQAQTGQVAILHGRLDSARNAFSKALALRSLFPEVISAFFGIAQVGIGLVDFERNQLEEADDNIRKGLTLLTMWNNLEGLILAYTTLARIHSIRREFEEAHRCLDAFFSLGRSEARNEQLTAQAARIEIWLKQGDLKNARRLILELPAEEKDVSPAVFADLALQKAHFYLALGKPQQVLALCQQVTSVLADTGMNGLLIKALVLSACAKQQSGNMQSASLDMRRALGLGKAEGYIRVFLDGGVLARQMIETFAAEGDGYAALLLDEFHKEVLPAPSGFAQPSSVARRSSRLNQELVEPLSDRELEVLELMAKGLTNGQIAAQFVLSVNTVKKHISNIFSKLDVETRIEAVERGRKLGLVR